MKFKHYIKYPVLLDLPNTIRYYLQVFLTLLGELKTINIIKYNRNEILRRSLSLKKEYTWMFFNIFRWWKCFSRMDWERSNCEWNAIYVFGASCQLRSVQALVLIKFRYTVQHCPMMFKFYDYLVSFSKRKYFKATTLYHVMVVILLSILTYIKLFMALSF